MDNPYVEFTEQGNPNVIPGGMPTDATFGLSRRDLYPDRAYATGARWRKLWDRFIG